MKLLHRKSGEFHEAIIELVQEEDWEIIEKDKTFKFNWKKEKKYLVHKITLKLEKEVLGLVSIEDVPKELRLFIRLIEVSKKHRGRKKVYDHVAGSLIAFTCNLAFQKDYNGFVSLIPKTELVNHYKSKYGFKEFGSHLYLELEKSENLIKKYLGNG